ncbi:MULTISPECIES: SRPBCC family protein [unclassified Streptomyces]|uniref:SRPBCC family protein n=1 Tax=unclassified Streptomyces TaxID=2593676 RepID=UPI00109E71F7|nr:SRPBCC family protein [Streptomyces sp. A1136]THA54644.1 cyclase [Streptomyces sp. A1136]
MSVGRAHRMSCAVDAAAPAGVLYALVADTTHWPLFLPGVLHVEPLDADGDTDGFRLWSAPEDSAVSSSRWRRNLDAGALRADFRREDPQAPFASVAGSLSVTRLAPGWSRLTLEQETTVSGVSGPSTARTRQALATAERDARAALNGLRVAAERWKDLDALLMTFEDRVRVAGTGEQLLESLYHVGAWPGRVPHVVRADVTEERPGVQRATLVRVNGDGSAYTTESVRVCFPAAGRIVHRRTRPHPLLAAHCGEWSVLPDAGAGCTVVARHAVLLDGRAVERAPGPGADPESARRRVREVLRRESEAALGQARQSAGGEGRALRAV